MADVQIEWQTIICMCLMCIMIGDMSKDIRMHKLFYERMTLYA